MKYEGERRKKELIASREETALFILHPSAFILFQKVPRTVGTYYVSRKKAMPFFTVCTKRGCLIPTVIWHTVPP
jgi:hypothetical protein